MAPYVKTIWVNDSVPAINSTNLNNIENGIADGRISSNITYDNAVSGLAATDVKAAIDELDATLDSNTLDVITRRKLYAKETLVVTPATDANVTLTAAQNGYGRLELTDGAWTGPHSIIIDASVRDLLADNRSGTYNATVIISGGSGTVVPPGEALWLYADGVDVFSSETQATGGTGGAGGVRQTVRHATVDANGFANFIAIGTGLAVDIAATAIPVEVQASGGAAGNDRVGSLDTDTSISGLTASDTNYLYADIDSLGDVTLGHTLLPPVYQFGGAYSVTSGQATFNTSEMTMKVGNGATADKVWRVFLGEAVTDATTVTSVVNYALNGMTDLISPVAASTQYLLNHNLGLQSVIVDVSFTLANAVGVFAVGEELDLNMIILDSGSSSVSSGFQFTRGYNYLNITTSSFLARISQITTLYTIAFTDLSNMKLSVRRGW